MTISILIPTHHNPGKLERCLGALEQQSHAPDEVIVMYEEGDEESRVLLIGYTGNLNLVPLELMNMEHMSKTMNAGIAEAKGDILGFLDEDVEPQREWVDKLLVEFGNDKIAACGGKDTIVVNGKEDFKIGVDDVGILKWKGYIVGNQHRGANRREVTFLKGCNMAVRRASVEKIDEKLIGLVRWEQDIFFALREKKGRVIYEPGIEVIHHKDSLHYLSSRYVFWFGHNTVYLFLKYLHESNKVFALLFCFFFGNASSPGVFRFLQWVLTRNDQALCSFCASLIGKMKALSTYRL
jgi:GT2 family glycosyltransferase